MNHTGCSIPILGRDEKPIGTINFNQEQIPDDMAQVSYQLNKPFILYTTICIEKGRAKLVSVRILHEAITHKLKDATNDDRKH